MNRPFVWALTMGVCAITTLGDEIEDLERYLDQFAYIERLRFDADYHTHMNPPPMVSKDPISTSGTYHYAFDEGRFVVESQIVCDNPKFAFQSRVGVYAFTGEHYLIYDAKDEEPESSEKEPPRVALRIVSNPILAPIGFLRSDLEQMTALGIEHFDSEADLREIEKNIASEKMLSDENNRLYIEITIDPERDKQHLGEGHYRVYMSDPKKYKSGFSLPERIEYWYNGRRWSTVAVLGYTPNQISERTLYLPSEVRISHNAGREDMGGVSRARVDAKITGYTDAKLPPSAFRPDLAEAGVTVKPDGAILWDAKPSSSGTPRD